MTEKNCGTCFYADDIFDGMDEPCLSCDGCCNWVQRVPTAAQSRAARSSEVDLALDTLHDALLSLDVNGDPDGNGGLYELIDYLLSADELNRPACRARVAEIQKFIAAKGQQMTEFLDKLEQELTVEVVADLVNHPPHYTGHPSGVECIQVTEHMNFCLGNAVKYIWRADGKGSAIEDLKKARWYIDREIERREKIA